MTKIKHYSVYRITCLATHKLYIGVTAFDIHKRWHEHEYIARRKKSKSTLHSAIRKYGSKSFIVAPVFSAFTRESAYDAEQKLITDYNTLLPFGYNMTIGGEGSSIKGRKHSAETKYKMSLTALGKKKSSEHIRKLSEAKKGAKHTTVQATAHRIAMQREGFKKRGKPQPLHAVIAHRICLVEKALANPATGVEKRKRRHPYRAQITKDSKKINLGSFNTVEEARAAYVIAASRYIEELRIELAQYTLPSAQPRASQPHHTPPGPV
jgi:group I intron endonuclease